MSCNGSYLFVPCASPVRVRLARIEATSPVYHLLGRDTHDPDPAQDDRVSCAGKIASFAVATARPGDSAAAVALYARILKSALANALET